MGSARTQPAGLSASARHLRDGHYLHGTAGVNRAGDGLRWGISRVRSRAVRPLLRPWSRPPPGCPLDLPLGSRPDRSESGRYGVLLGWSHSCLLQLRSRIVAPDIRALRAVSGTVVLPFPKHPERLRPYSTDVNRKIGLGQNVFATLGRLRGARAGDQGLRHRGAAVQKAGAAAPGEVFGHASIQRTPVSVRLRSANHAGRVPTPLLTITVAVMPATSGTSSGT